ncbi:KANSL3 family protein [Megaselia abdita]
MEHIYSRDSRPIENANGLSPARTLLIHKAPNCPSCHTQPSDDGTEFDEQSHQPIPSYNETMAKDAMGDSLRVAKSVKNLNPDDEDWEERLFKQQWFPEQRRILERVAQILNSDQLSRLANVNKAREPVQRRLTIDKSAQRFREILSNLNWEARHTQWLHGLLMDYLPPTYMAAYLDILQTLKAKVPSLVEKMVFGRPNPTYSKEVLSPVLMDKWEPNLTVKNRPLPENTIFVVIPSHPTTGPIPDRLQKWYKLFGTCTQIVQINMAVGGNTLTKQTFDQVAEQIVSLTRLKIKDLKAENPNRHIVLIGFNAGSSLALQVAFSESVSSVICMGFAYNTMTGPRGSPEDHLLDLRVPVLFAIGQNSAKASQEEMESLREKMHSESSLLVVGSADDCLRVPTNKCKIEGVTQDMVNSMIMDEIYEFIKKCIINPPGTRQPLTTPGNFLIRKRKAEDGSSPGNGLSSGEYQTSGGETKAKYTKTSSTTLPIGRPRTRPIIQSVQTIVPAPSKSEESITDDSMAEGKQMTTYEIVPQSKIQKTYGIPNKVFKTGGTLSTPQGTKIKMVPANQFVQLKPPIQSQSKIYTIKPTQSQQLQQTPSQYVASPQKFTILKPGTPIIRGTNKDIDKQPSTSATTDIGSIIDMPILFADNDGNIQETPSSSPAATKPNQFVIYNTSTSTVTSGVPGNAIDANKPKKVVFINRTTMKPCPNIISKSTVPPLHKYSKVVVTNPKSSAGTLVTRQISVQPPKPTTSSPGVLNVQQKPIIINMNADKLTGKPQQILKLGDPIKKTFVFKTATGGLKNITGIKPINRNLTVRKIDYSGNVVTTTATSNLLASLVQSAPKASEPKIFTLQPSPTATGASTPVTKND